MASVRKSAAKAGPEGTAGAAPAEGALPEMSLADVKKHADEKDCLVAIDGLVCDVTEYLPNHPGSMEQLLDVAGEPTRALMLRVMLPRATCAAAKSKPTSPAAVHASAGPGPRGSRCRIQPHPATVAFHSCSLRLGDAGQDATGE